MTEVHILTRSNLRHEDILGVYEDQVEALEEAVKRNNNTDMEDPEEEYASYAVESFTVKERKS